MEYLLVSSSYEEVAESISSCIKKVDWRASFTKENEEVAEAISSCVEVDWRMQELIDIVNEYMDNSLVNLDSFVSLHRYCDRARDFLSLISLALEQFDEEAAEGGASNSDALGGQSYGKTLETLTKLVGAEDPFPEELLKTLHSQRHRQISLLDKVKLIHTKLDKKMKGKGVEVCRNVLNAMVSATSMSLQFCSDGVAEVAVPPVARVVQAGASSVIGLMKGPRRKVSDKEWRESVNTIHRRQYMAANDLDNLERYVYRLKDDFDSVKQFVGFVTESEMVKLVVEGEMVKLVVKEMRRSSVHIADTLNALEECVFLGFSQIQRARALLLQQMVMEISKRD
ncbi:hypothetical protein MLD38_013835 [Melastoma candidum]|uniref:Uncharacterized protein n=1 Tax=Melastoma candidum TaxID=119954 RepID=A0ACB9RAU7_9MYRT|nr:hypothetical protein MLD38_013835 [Melastoma candidum]